MANRGSRLLAYGSLGAKTENPGMYQTTAEIEGMMCGMCEVHVQDAIRKSLNVQSVKASRAKGRAVILSEKPITEEELRPVIDETGYRLLGLRCEVHTKKKAFSFFHRS